MGVLSHFVQLKFGAPHGPVLSPVLCAVYLDELFDHRQFDMYSFIIVYTDYIILIQSVSQCDKL